MTVAIEDANALYIFKPPAGYRTSDQLAKKLRELRKKDAAVAPSCDHASSVPQLRYFAEHVRGEWGGIPAIHSPEMKVALGTSIGFEFYRSWMKVVFSPSLDKALKAPFYDLALELELAAVAE